jgi:hypothetical protein
MCGFAVLASASEFESIFDGRSLAGWETPDLSYWSVEEGAITGRITREHPCETNQYLVWKGGELADFELKLKSRLNGEGGINNGFQFRSRLLPDHDVCGYQMDNNLKTPWLARLYDEYGRHTLAMRGEQAVFDAEGKRSAVKLPEAQGDAWFRLEDWHEYHLVCAGPKITLRINDRLVAEVEDHDPRRRELQGILALQLHSGPPTVVQFKDIRLKVLKPAEPTQVARPNPDIDALRRDAVAWWPLDTGGHGAKPLLRHIPGFEKFELKVRAAGPGARPDHNVVVLDGAYFEAGPDLQPGETALTVYLRARDPFGTWNATLVSGGEAFKLLAADLPQTPGADIAFEITTDRGAATVSFPISQIDPTAWHDLVGSYNGRTLTLFCDGKKIAAKPWSSPLKRNSDSLLIGAGKDGGKVAQHFRGELEEAALWSRALSDREVAALSARQEFR